MIVVTPTLSIDERDIEERFVRSSGPGGQNVNKVATAVQLRFDIKGSSLPDAVKHRLLALAGSRITVDGVLVIEAREHRTQSQNREAARERLVTLVGRATHPPKKRRPTTPGGGAREQRLASKKRRGVIKARRHKTIADE